MIWSILWIVLLVVAYLASEGEPVCEGPLILAVAESNPPKCDSPLAGLPRVGLTLYALGFAAATTIAAVWTLLNSRKSKQA